MALLDKLTKATQDMVRGTKDFTDIARQNSLIAEEQKQIAQLFSQIGELYYKTGESVPETQLGKMCMAIDAAYARINKYNDAIREIKGTKHCPTCGKDIPLASVFCGECGAQLTADKPPETARKTCSACGAEMPEDNMFCTACGHKQEQEEQ